MKLTDVVLGKGTYGVVYKGFNRKGEVCAIKQFRSETTSEGVDIGILRELAYLRSLSRHPNIIQLGEVEWCENSKNIQVEMPLYAKDLNHYVKKERVGPLSLDEARSYSTQLLRALHHCHKHGIFHRDVKPANLLLDNNGNMVLCDFSLASNFVSKINHSNQIMTLW